MRSLNFLVLVLAEAPISSIQSGDLASYIPLNFLENELLARCPLPALNKIVATVAAAAPARNVTNDLLEVPIILFCLLSTLYKR